MINGWTNPDRLPAVTPLQARRAAAPVLDALRALSTGGSWPANDQRLAMASRLTRVLYELSFEPAHTDTRVLSVLAELGTLTETPTRDRLETMAIGLAGRRLSAGAGRPCQEPPDGGGVWGLTLIESALPNPARLGSSLLRLLIVAGPKAGTRYQFPVNSFWTRAALQRQIKRPAMPLDATDLGGWYFMAWYGNDGALAPERLHLTSSLHSHNHDLLKGRSLNCIKNRFPGQVCLRGCPMSRTDCWLSRHVETWQPGPCRNVTTHHNGFITPSGWCGHCLLHGAYEPIPTKKDK